MRTISDTMTRLAAFRVPSGFAANDTGPDILVPMTEFGSNPGSLKAYTYAPEGLPDNAPLVVVMHGCTQSAAGYNHGSGWSELADRYKFALLFPEQQRANNANLCFNWFSHCDTRRGAGEALSIRQMVSKAVAEHGIDASRIYVTGLSAGGAMTSVMLAVYPDVFAGGAIIAGLPYGDANSVPQAFDRMRGQGGPEVHMLEALVRRASDHAGPWPTVSVWHGTGDATVDHSNAAAIIGQWRALHGVDAAPTRTEEVDGQTHRIWCSGDGREVIEEYVIEGMGHGTPLDTTGEDGVGSSGAYMLDTGISSTLHIARFWKLGEAVAARPKAQAHVNKATRIDKPVVAEAVKPVADPVGHAKPRQVAATGVQKVIEDALRAAGLMR